MMITKNGIKITPNSICMVYEMCPTPDICSGDPVGC